MLFTTEERNIPTHRDRFVEAKAKKTIVQGQKKLLAWPGQRKSVDIIKDYYLRKRNFLDMIEVKGLK